MIKYSHRGLVKNGTKNYNLFDLLYKIYFFSWSSAFYIISIIKSIKSSAKPFAKEIDIVHDKLRVKTGIGFIHFLAFLLMFLNVQFIKKKRPSISKIQHNIITFNQSFYLYVVLFLSEWLLKNLRENKNDKAIFIFISKTIFFHFLVPCMIMWHLRICMPLFFSKNKPEKLDFYISGWNIAPRQQVFLLPSKQFVSNARWGSVAKFRRINENVLPNHNTGKSKFKSLLPTVYEEDV